MTLRIFVLPLLLLARCGLAAAAEPGPERPPTAQEVVSRLEARFSKVADYECVMESDIRRGKEASTGTYRIWFRKPELFRLKVERGRHTGSQIALNRAGKVRARPGGLLRNLVAKTMSRDDRRLRSPRGGYPWEASYASLIPQLKRQVELAKRVEVRAVPAAPAALGLEVECADPGQRALVREVCVVETSRWLITAYDSYEGGADLERRRFTGYRENLGLPETFFDL